MKFVKKLTCLFLAIVMTMAMGITAFAAESTYSITINGNSAHTYEAYQIFSGKLSDDEQTLSDVDWGKGVNSSALLDALKNDTTIGSDFADCTTAAAVAKVLEGYTNDSAKLIAFSKVVGSNLSSTVAGTSTENKLKDNKGDETGKSEYTIGSLEPGYYLVKDKDNTAPSDEAYTRYILNVVKDVEVDAKDSVPEITKKIVEGTDRVDANTASIGGNVPYELKSAVPDMTGYTKYYFVVNDTMSKGLTFNNDVAITIGDTTLTKDTDYTVSSEPNDTTGGTEIKIVFKNFIQYANQKDAAITITYSATLNQDAVITDAGNPNKVTLTYSNNPNVAPKGEGDEPGSDDKEITGETPEDKVITYVTGVKLIKVDAKDNSKTLTGAKFQISGTSKKVVIINSEMYKKSETGTYYMLKNGTYTTTAPTQDTTDSDGTVHKGTADQYDSTTQRYEKVTVVNKETKAEEIQAEGYVDGKGVLRFVGLGEGEYTITELVAPDGYNKLDKPISVKITANETLDGGASWTVKVNDKEVSADTADNLYKFNVENNSGAKLPSTGGMGTTVIYVAGIAMIVAAGVVIIARKRMA